MCDLGFFFVKQKTAYEMRISDWSSDVCSSDLDELEAFNAAVARVPEIQSCHMIAGGYDYLLKVRTSNIEAYRQVLGAVISRLPGVLQTHTYVVMETVKDDVTLTIPQQAP